MKSGERQKLIILKLGLGGVAILIWNYLGGFDFDTPHTPQTSPDVEISKTLVK